MELQIILATMWVLEIGPCFSGRTTSALKHGAWDSLEALAWVS